MAKNFSIRVENDEVVAVEVDGVSYANADEIPDPRDREKALELIAKMNEAGSDDETDADFDREFKDFDKHFDQEFKEIQRESARFPTLFFSIFFGVAVLMLGIAAFSAFRTYQAVAKEQAAPGKVVDLVERRSVETTTGEIRVYSYPVVEYRAASSEAQLLRVELSEGSSPPEYQVGDAVTILYNPDRPRDARIKSFSSNLLTWLVPAITGLIGTVFLAVSLIVLRVHRSQVEELEKEGIMV